VCDLPPDVKGFDCAIANPPFGRIRSSDTPAPRYGGAEFEYKVLDVASGVADYGVFLIPQSSSPFRLSGSRCFEEQSTEKYNRLVEQTQIELQPNCGLDTSVFEGEWHSTSVRTEIVVADFREARARREAVGKSESLEELEFTNAVLASNAPLPVQQSLFAL
jgi:hypothetical protein